MMQRTKLEMYAYSRRMTLRELAKLLDVSIVTLWKWIYKKAKPTVRNAEYVQLMTNGEITVQDLRK